MLSGTDLQYAYSMDSLVPQSHSNSQISQQQAVSKPSSGNRSSRSTMLNQNLNGTPVSIYSHKVKEAFDDQHLQYEQQQQQQVRQVAVAQPVQIVTQQQPQAQTQSTPQPTYLDQMVSKRRDMLKVIIFAISILLAISLHTVVEFWLKEISVSKELAFKQELGLRALYPILIVLTLWLLKSFQGAK